MSARASKPAPREVKLADVEAILARGRRAPLSDEDCAELVAMARMLAFVTALVNAKRVSIKKLKQLIFGAKTEKMKDVLGATDATPAEPVADTSSGGAATPADASQPAGEGGDDKKREGHGRNGAAAFVGAERVPVKHPSMKRGDCCARCSKGRLYPLSEPAMLVRITGLAPLGADVYELEQLRCNLCGEVAKAPPPPGIGEKKYDESATAMIGALKYGAGLPFNRIEKLQQGMGIPLPAATQWDLVHAGARHLLPVWHELTRQAAQGEVLHNDDTRMKVLELTPEVRAQAAADEETDGERTGSFTSGIVARHASRDIALFFTGVQHAGENLADVIKQRAAALPPPIQMCDALDANTAGDFETILANCLTHARRKYVDVAESFPVECLFVLEILRDVYRNDAHARVQKLSRADRLLYHQTESGPAMTKLEAWMRQSLEEKRVEPNSGLGEALRYMRKHWQELTLFLRVPGAPLDNNICERTLKRAILHRMNSLFYKTLNGALVGDIFMSLIHTADLNGISSFDYLVTLLRHHEELRAQPADWMPWSYAATLARLHASTSG